MGSYRSMIFYTKRSNILHALLLITSSLATARSVIVEFKGAYFLPTDYAFKSIYTHGNGMYGPEITVQIVDEQPWHIFTSFDYFEKKGVSVGFKTPTKVTLLPLSLGIKYFFPTYCARGDFYIGLGAQAVDIRTKNCSPFVIQEYNRWGFGGIAKAGIYWYTSSNVTIDMFIDYSFVKTANSTCWCPQQGVQELCANVSGALFGIGFGYRF